MSDSLLARLRQAVDSAAATFDGRGSRVKERELELAIESALRALGLAPLRQVPLRLSDSWSGRVGGVDLALEDLGDESRILIELKWDASTLAACAWDSMKLAAALQAGEGERAFLIAGSPRVEPPIKGDELLDDRVLAPAALRQAFAEDFDYWKADVENHPERAPAEWLSKARHSASLRYKDAEWRIRLTELTISDPELVEVE